jgi:hypothetical protein
VARRRTHKLANSANAQPAARVPTVGVLIGLADDAEARGRSMAFEQGLERGVGPSAKTFASSTAMPKAILCACRLLRTSWFDSSTIPMLVTMNVRGLVASGLPRAGLRISHHSAVPLPAFAQLVD